MDKEKPAALHLREAGAIVNGFVLYLILVAVSTACLVLGSMFGRIVGLVLLVGLLFHGRRVVRSVVGQLAGQS